jgi:hypothetical protein
MTNLPDRTPSPQVDIEHHGARCASCGSLCGPGAVYCPGTQLAGGTLDHRDEHALCRACLSELMSSEAACQAVCERIERSLAWRGHA